MTNQFLLWKKQALLKLDKSSEGKIDEKILELCNTINKRDDMFTLSSCSGRISILNRENNSKKESIWLFKFHDKVKSIPILKNKKLEFRQEAPILHVCTKNLETANKLMSLAKESGFNQVGIIANKTKIVVELICDLIISFPFQNIDDKFLENILEKANENLEEGWRRVEKLQQKLS